MSDEPRTPVPADQTSPLGDPTEVIDTGQHQTEVIPLPDEPASEHGGDASDWFDVAVPAASFDAHDVPSPPEHSWDAPAPAPEPEPSPESASDWPDPSGGPAVPAEARSAAYSGMNRTIPLGPARPLPLPAPTTAPRRSRGPFAALVVALCLVSGVIGGAAGQLLAERPTAGSTLPQPGPGATARPSGSVASIAARAVPSVVTIQIKGGEGDATGSGFVIDGKGHILTNNHVVAPAGSNGSIQVVLSNGDSEPATIVGRDASYDLAVIKVSRTDLTPLVLGQSGQVVVGDEVIAVGAPLGLDQTVTSGIVSALNRPVTPGAGDDASYINAIQTDAAINPGNSGGPLLDMLGQVIGINSAIARVPGSTASTGGNIGLGFAIPSDQARRTADQLIASGHATHPIIGVLLDRTFAGEGAEVSSGKDAVTAGGPADKAGIKPGDVIIGFEGERIRTPDQLIVSIRARAVGDTVSLTVKRGSEKLDLRMTLEASPSD